MSKTYQLLDGPIRSIGAGELHEGERAHVACELLAPLVNYSARLVNPDHASTGA
jgi:hypothetical protein